ncbi:MAG: HDOD domain-containing protein [bacterium]
MSTDIFQTILDEHQELSSLPQTLVEVLRVAGDEDSSAGDLADVLRRDPALTVRILRTVNSPFYGAGREISSVRQGVMMLGIRAVTAIALSASVYDLTGRWSTTFDQVRFWRHSLEVAVAARMIAEAVGHSPVEEAFACGLLHDIGLLVLQKAFPDESQRIWGRSVSEDEAVEQEEQQFGTNHARVGQFLMEQWKLPVSMCEAVGHHYHDFGSDTWEPDLRLPQTISLAEVMARFTVTDVGAMSPSMLDRKKNLTSSLKLSDEKLTEIEKTHLDQTMVEAQFLEIEVGSPSDLLAEANRMLFHQYETVEGMLREQRRMQQKLAQAELDRAALETLKTISATFNHYINNALGTILGRAQLVQVTLQKDDVVAQQEAIDKAMRIILAAVKTVQSVMEELTRLTSFETTIYHDDDRIIDLKKQLGERFTVDEPETVPT